MNTIIEKIRAEVERLKNANAKLGHTNDIERYEESAYGNACDTILSRLSDLEKEEKPTTAEGLEEEIERYLSTELELDEDLNKDEPIYIYDCTWEDLKILARHFAQLGAEWQKEQMIKEAVETWMLEGSMFEPEFIKRKVIIIKEDKQ